MNILSSCTFGLQTKHCWNKLADSNLWVFERSIKMTTCFRWFYIGKCQVLKIVLITLHTWGNGCFLQCTKSLRRNYGSLYHIFLQYSVVLVRCILNRLCVEGTLMKYVRRRMSPLDVYEIPCLRQKVLVGHTAVSDIWNLCMPHVCMLPWLCRVLALKSSMHGIFGIK